MYTRSSGLTAGVYVGMYEKMDRVTVAEAAARLGVKEQAVRKRMQRGTLVHDKDEDGRVYVYLDPGDESDSTGNSTVIGTEMDTLVQSLQDQIEYLRAELQRRGETYAEEARRKDTIIAQLTQRIPELPSSASSPEPRDGPETASEGEPSSETPTNDTGEPRRRSWWREFFGIE